MHKETRAYPKSYKYAHKYTLTHAQRSVSIDAT